jgi:hypothetical protein
MTFTLPRPIRFVDEESTVRYKAHWRDHEYTLKVFVEPQLNPFRAPTKTIEAHILSAPVNVLPEGLFGRASSSARYHALTAVFNKLLPNLEGKMKFYTNWHYYAYPAVSGETIIEANMAAREIIHAYERHSHRLWDVAADINRASPGRLREAGFIDDLMHTLNGKRYSALFIGYGPEDLD